MINPPNDLGKCIMGALVHSMEKHIYSALSFWLVKYTTSSQKMDKLLEIFSDCVNISCTDFISFESAIKRFLQHCVETRGYEAYAKRMDAASIEIKALVLGLVMPQIYNCPEAQFTTDPMRASGTPPTALMNALVQAVCNLFCYWRAESASTNISKSQFLSREMNKDRDAAKVKMLVEGDDGLHSHPTVSVTADMYKDLGIRAKIIKESSIYTSSFCGQVFSTTKVLFYDSIKFLMRLGWVGAKYHGASPKTKRALAAAKVLSYMCCFTQCPIIYPICLSIYNELGIKVSAKYLKAIS